MGTRRTLSIVLVGGVVLTLVASGLATPAPGTGSGAPATANDSESPDSGNESENGLEALDYRYTITEDGDVEAITVRMVVSEDAYERWWAAAYDEGHENVSSWVGAELAADEDILREYTGSEHRRGDRYEVSVRFTDVDAADAGGLTASATGEIVTWGLVESEPETDTDWNALTYTAALPDEITASNADRVDGDTAVWEIHESNPGQFYAQSSPGSDGPDGNATVSAGMEYEVTVAEDGTVDAIEMTLSTDRETYELWSVSAASSGRDGVGDLFGAIFVEDEAAVGEYTAEDAATETGYESSVQFGDIDVERSENTSITVTDGTLRWETTGVEELEEDDAFSELTYTVVMPDEITETNAAERSNETATWYIHEDHPGTLTAEVALETDDERSDEATDDERSNGDADDGTADGDGEAAADGTDTDDAGGVTDGVPSVGVVGTLVAVLTGLLVRIRRSA